ncbi:hypothetical protein FRB90_005203 [Tulasnella sp. 427]|nr:hypothetical protein FRB90_005203 [Tulasnella sp. 427]
MWTTAGVIFISFLVMKFGKKEPYGLYHKALNIAVDGAPTDTQWMNVGYWKEVTTFPNACEALALKVIRAARPGPGGHVLGHGSGDSLILHALYPSSPSLKTLTGITSNKDQHAEAERRIQVMCGQNSLGVKLHLYQGDAIFRPLDHAFNDDAHPLDPASQSPPFTAITAIDCAYHFRSRRAFLQQSFERLAPGGSIALADMGLVLPQSPFRRVLARIVCGTLGIPWDSMVSRSDYVSQLQGLGFVNVDVEDITQDVFPHLIGFLKNETSGSPKLGRAWWIMGEVFRIWWKSCGGIYIIAKAEKPI